MPSDSESSSSLSSVGTYRSRPAKLRMSGATAFQQQNCNKTIHVNIGRSIAVWARRGNSNILKRKERKEKEKEGGKRDGKFYKMTMIKNNNNEKEKEIKNWQIKICVS